MATWTPARWAAVGLIAYVVLIAVSPLQYDTSVITLDAALYAVTVLGAFFGGCWIVSLTARSDVPPRPLPVAIPADRLINITLALGTIGIVARIYDRFILRNFVLVADNFNETRESIAEGVSVFGYIGGLLFSFGLISVLLIWLSSSQRRRPFTFAFAAFLALYPALEALLSGSRSILVHVAFLIFFFARSTNAIPWLVRSPLALVGAALALSGFLELIYELRSLQGNMDDAVIADVFRDTQIAQYAAPPQWLTAALINNEGNVIGSVLKVWTHMIQYLTHSWIVYFINFENFQGVFGWGRLHLPLPVRALSAVLQEDFNYDPTLYGYELGVSPTAISGIYYDFGMLGPLMAGAFGAFATWIHRLAIRHPERWLPISAYLCLGCLAMMVDNQLVGGLGGFAVWTFVAYGALNALLSILSYGGAETEVVGSTARAAVST